MNLNNKILEIIKNNNITINNIVEIGSRDGDDCNYFKNKLNIKNENIYTFEPNTPQYNLICKKYPNFNNYNYCVSDEIGEKNFISVKDKVGISSLYKRTDNLIYNYDIIKVKCITGQYIIDNIIKNIDLCKIDVEGHTYNVIKSFNSLKNINMIIMEVEYKMIWDGQKIYKDIKNILSKTHKEIWNSYIPGDRQSNTIWLLK